MEIDRSIIGNTTPRVVFDVEKGLIKRFADTVGDPNPLYRDEDAAKRTRHGGIIAPPIFPSALILATGFPFEFEPRRSLHGEEEFIFHRQIRAGERLYCQAKVIDVYEREGRSGPMKFIVTDTEAHDETGASVVTCRMTMVYR